MAASAWRAGHSAPWRRVRKSWFPVARSTGPHGAGWARSGGRSRRSRRASRRRRHTPESWSCRAQERRAAEELAVDQRHQRGGEQQDAGDQHGGRREASAAFAQQSPRRGARMSPPELPAMLMATAPTAKVPAVNSEVGSAQNAPCAAPRPRPATNSIIRPNGPAPVAHAARMASAGDERGNADVQEALARAVRVPRIIVGAQHRAGPRQRVDQADLEGAEPRQLPDHLRQPKHDAVRPGQQAEPEQRRRPHHGLTQHAPIVAAPGRGRIGSVARQPLSFVGVEPAGRVRPIGKIETRQRPRAAPSATPRRSTSSASRRTRTVHGH